MADVDAALPLKAAQLDLAVAVHCSIHDNLPAIGAALAPGGFLIYETFGGQGMNWLELPKAGHLKRKLGRGFKLLVLEERRVVLRKRERSLSDCWRKSAALPVRGLRPRSYYDQTFDFLRSCGLPHLDALSASQPTRTEQPSAARQRRLSI